MIINTADNPYEKAKALYDSVGVSFRSDLETYLKEGYVFATPNYLLMGKRVGNGWYIHMAVGKNALAEFWKHMPYYLPWIGWGREWKGRPQIKWHKTERVLKTMHKLRSRYGRS